MSDITANVAFIQKQIKQLHAPQPVSILAVSKKQSISAIKLAFDAGITNFGENYWQEANEKIKALADYPITWHFIGDIQSNKCAAIANSVDWIHSISRFKIAQLLSESRVNASPLNLCIQVNLSREPSKSGIEPTQIFDFIQQILPLPHLTLRGLMVIPKVLTNINEQYQLFLQLHQLLLECNRRLGLKLDTLSMGMSQDYLPAIQAGSTIVRIGRNIFGNR